MSGHSKWSTIKRQKGAADAKRGQTFTKLSNAITIAVRGGGGITDTVSNFKLRLAIDRAKSFNMPKENIDRAINRAAGSAEGSVEDLLYEGFGPGGVAILVEAVTDNKQRTVSSVKNVFEKNGGTLGSSGSVSYLFERLGEITLQKNGKSSDELLERGINAGALDMEEEGDSVFFRTDPKLLQEVKNALDASGIISEDAQLVYVPKNPMTVDEQTKSRVVDLMGKLGDLDDVHEVYSNLAA